MQPTHKHLGSSKRRELERAALSLCIVSGVRVAVPLNKDDIVVLCG